MMRRHTLLRWLLIVLVAAMAGAAAAAKGFGFSAQELVRPLGILMPIGLVALYYHRRKEERFVLCLVTLSQIVLFSLGFALLMYVAAPAGRPLIDDRLVACDACLGFHLPDVVAWRTGHPWIGTALERAYDSMLLQTAAIVVILGLFGDRKPLESFVLRMMLGALVVLALFIVMPAEGPFSAYGFAPSPSQARYLDHLHTLRSGERTYFSYGETEGLITFPSFHTIWALLLAVACLHRPVVFWPFMVLNAAVILATMTTGWHYMSDVLAGVGVTAAVCHLTCWADGWLERTVLPCRWIRWSATRPCA